jgi:hypothetical protein
MTSRSLGSLILVSILVAFFVASCAAPVEAPATPTHTPTPSFTPTVPEPATATATLFLPPSTPIPSITPLPPPPVTVTGCVLLEDCPEAKLVDIYLGTQLKNNEIYTVEFHYTEKMLVVASWCAVDEGTLKENLKQIRYLFTIDGVSYLDLAKVSQGTRISQDKYDRANVTRCTYIGAMLSGWPEWESYHEVRIGYRFPNGVYDGLNNYNPFTISYGFVMRPFSVATQTPQYLPPCDVSSSISVNNTTGSIFKLFLTGPADYEFVINPGQNNLPVCPGYYHYEGKGCGTLGVDSGTLSSGESYTFYCK